MISEYMMGSSAGSDGRGLGADPGGDCAHIMLIRMDFALR